MTERFFDVVKKWKSIASDWLNRTRHLFSTSCFALKWSHHHIITIFELRFNRQETVFFLVLVFFLIHSIKIRTVGFVSNLHARTKSSTDSFYVRRKHKLFFLFQKVSDRKGLESRRRSIGLFCSCRGHHHVHTPVEKNYVINTTLDTLTSSWRVSIQLCHRLA
jgi:hypothetical protein